MRAAMNINARNVFHILKIPTSRRYARARSERKQRERERERESKKRAVLERGDPCVFGR
jgi:precorrin-6B methylase 1